MVFLHFLVLLSLLPFLNVLAISKIDAEALAKLLSVRVSSKQSTRNLLLVDIDGRNLTSESGFNTSGTPVDLVERIC